MIKFTKLFAVLGVLFASGAAYAAPIDLDAFKCSDGLAINGVSVDDVTGNAGGASDCFGTFDGNDPNAAGDGIETGGVTFDFISRQNVDENSGALSMEEGSADIGLNIYNPIDGCMPGQAGSALNGAASSGCWSYDPTKFSADAFIIVIKAANSPGWGAWLFEDGDAASTWGSWAVGWVANGSACTGHTNKDGSAGSGNCAQISHLTIFASGGTRLPEPTSLALLGIGLIGLGFARKRAARA